MANPQVENGYTKIANELIEALYRTKLNGTQFRIVLAIIRYTYGFSKKETNMSLSFISSATNQNRNQVKREIDELIKNNILTVVKEFDTKNSRTLQINKDYENWTGYTVFEKEDSTLNSVYAKKSTPEYAKKSTPKKEKSDSKIASDEVITSDSTVSTLNRVQYSNQSTNKEILNKTINKVVESKNPHKEIVSYFCDKHKESTSFPYKFNGGKDGKILTDLLKTYDAETMKKIIDWYFVTDDDFLLKAGYNIGMLKTAIPKYISSLNKSKQAPKAKRDPYQEA